MYYRYRGEDWYRLKRSASEERMEQVREIDGEQAYEKMRRAMEKADQEKARQVERSTKLPVRKRPERAWAGTRGTGAGLWPQPLILGGCPRKNADPMQQEDWPN